MNQKCSGSFSAWDYNTIDIDLHLRKLMGILKRIRITQTIWQDINYITEQTSAHSFQTKYAKQYNYKLLIRGR